MLFFPSTGRPAGFVLSFVVDSFSYGALPTASYDNVKGVEGVGLW